MSAVEKILVRGVNWLGDAVMTTPALQRLREARPNAEITMLTPAKLADLWRHHPSIDDVIAFTDAENVLQVGRRLRWGNFDTALIFPNSPRSALESWLGKIPRRIGYARPWRNLFLTDKIAPRPGEMKMHKRSIGEIKRIIDGGTVPAIQYPSTVHHIHQYLHLVSVAFGASPEPLAPHLATTPEEVAALKRRFEIEDTRPLFGLNPGAEYGPAKRWPKERFIETALEMQRKLNCGWIVFGGRADMELANKITSAIQGKGGERRVWNLAGKTSLRELCAALKLCRALLTNDTGPMHVAAALDTPVVVLFGSTSSELTGPGLPGNGRHQFIRSDAACSPCFLRECPIDFRCMHGITTDPVVEALLAASGLKTPV